VLADSRQRILRIAHRQRANGRWELYLDGEWDLSAHVPHDCMSPAHWFPKGECDPMTAVMPDSDGYIWWVTRRGRIGTLDPRSGAVTQIRLAGEEIQNGFSVDREAVYIVSDHALYALARDAENRPRVLWREPYDRGSGRKLGSIDQGSGTTPTLFGKRYITITDNADPRVHLLVYRRRPAYTGKRLLCKLPLFEPGASATDNSMIAYGRSIILENNHGYRNAIQQTDFDHIAGGIVRVDLREDESGCDVIWRSPEKAPSNVPKLSAATGLAFFYTFAPSPAARSASARGARHITWYLTALDFRTGRTVYKIRTGSGRGFDNNWAPITLGPDGTAYVGTLDGIVAIRDRPERTATASAKPQPAAALAGAAPRPKGARQPRP